MIRKLSDEKEMVEFTIKCTELRNTDTLGKSDPRCLVKLKDREGRPQIIGSTECIENTLNPVFSKIIKLEKNSDFKQVLQFIVEDSDAGDKYEFIGSIEVDLDALIGAPAGEWTGSLKHSDNPKNGDIHIKTRVLQNDPIVYHIDLKCMDVADIETFSKVTLT